eukprot:COSAG06_NODE_3794_length_4898_cov_43.804082_3_plen_145_part_00
MTTTHNAAVPRRKLCRIVLLIRVLFCFVLFCCVVLCCVVLCCAVLCCVVLCCAVLCCAVRCGAVLCYAVLYRTDSLSGKPWSTWILCTQETNDDTLALNQSLLLSKTSGPETSTNSASTMVEVVAHMDRSSADQRNGYWKEATR